MALETTNVSDLDVESTRLILNLLPPKDLCCVASTCRYFYRAIFDGPFTERLWRSHCIELLGEGVVALHKAAIPPGYEAGAIFWRNLWLAGKGLDNVRWWRNGANQLKASVDRVDSAKEAAETEVAQQAADAIAADNADGLGEDRRKAVLAEAEAAAAGQSTLKAKLARSGHAAAVVGTKIVITGGILRDGSLIVDVVVIDLPTMSVIRPPCEGEAPSTRFRHTMVPISPSPRTPLYDMVSEALGSKDSIHSGQLLLIFGGYNTIGEEFGANSTFVLWAATDGSRYVWREITTQGTPPTPRFHHSCDSFSGGRKAVIFGGEGYMLEDTGESSSPCVYIFDSDLLVWTRGATHAPGDEHNPGARSLHVTMIRESAATGHEELVVVGGYFTSVLAAMKPYTLDLETLEWRCWEGRNPDVPDSPKLPEPRQRMAAMRISKDWLLISGGSPASGSFLDDLQRLHVPSLTWGRAPEVSGRPSRALRRIAGHTFAGLLAFGGCIPTIMGIMPVEKLDLLLLGQGNAGVLPAVDPGAETLRCAGNAPLREGTLGVQRSSAAVLGTKAEKKQQALSSLTIKRTIAAEEAPESSTAQKEQAQEQQGTSDPDSPMLDPSKKEGPVDLETAAHDGVFNQFVADQLLSKGQLINIGSPDTYFRPAYATVSGVKSAPDADNPSQFAKGRLQVINTSLLSDAQHIEQMNRQFHPSQRGQSVPEPTPSADGLSQVQAGSGSLSAGDPLTGPSKDHGPAAAERQSMLVNAPDAAELAAQLSSMALQQLPLANPPAGAPTRRQKPQGPPVQYTAEEKGKQKAVPQASYQPIGDSQEARELEESLLLSRLQVAGASSCKVLATNDPNMPGGPSPTAQMQTTMYLNGMTGLDVPPLALQPQSAPVQGQDSFTWPVGTLASYPMPAAIPGFAPQDLMASAQSTLDAHRIFMVSSVRNDEIASRGPNPFAGDCSRPWGGGNPGMGPYMVPPTMQQPSTRPPPGPPFKPHIVNQASGHPQGWPMTLPPPLAQLQPEAPPVPNALAKGNHLPSGTELLRSRSPSAADLSGSCSFASAASQDLSDALPEEDDLEVQRRLAHEYWWAQQDRHPGLIQPPSMLPAPLKQIADTRSNSSLDEDRLQQKAIVPAPANASKPPKDRFPQSEGHRDRRGPYPGPDSAATETPKTMQLWRDVRTGQYFRLIPTTAADHEQNDPLQPPHWPRTKTQHVQRSQHGHTAALDDVDGNADGSAWSADPVRSTCCIQ